MLDDIDETALEIALVAIGREASRIYFPTPGEIRGVLDRVRLESTSDAAERAWQIVQNYMAKWGCPAKEQTRVIDGKMVSEKPPVLQGSIAAAIAATGGYDALYHTGIEHAHFARERFVEAFRRSAERQTRGLLTVGDAQAALALIEAGNVSRGAKSDPLT